LNTTDVTQVVNPAVVILCYAADFLFNISFL